MRVLKFQIRLPSGQVEQLNIEAERVLVGSGAHCEIRLPIDRARVEHAAIEAGAAGVFARALAFEPPPTINNIPFQQAPLPPGSVLGVGGCQIVVELVETEAATGTQKKKKTSPIMIIALGIMILVGGYEVFLDSPTDTKMEPPPSRMPELFGPPVTACPNAQAAAFANEQLANAEAKRARAPFHVQDGVQAVPLFETAAACFRVGGDVPLAAAAEQSAARLRRDIMEDFRTRSVRLVHALAIEDYGNAQKEVRVLLQFTEGKSGKYITWLQDRERELKLKVGTNKS
ncbi:MAG: FHA domain-containing protein [Polyangiaceae bacterium]|nr:FHA domain-containing protein [Polyangiaceae bacterium]